jgi:hypothetical protein
MKTNWRVRLNGKGSSIINPYPISAENLIKELKKNFKTVEIID